MWAGSVHADGRRDTASIGAVRSARFAGEREEERRRVRALEGDRARVEHADPERRRSSAGGRARARPPPAAPPAHRAARSAAAPARPGACRAVTRRTRSAAAPFGLAVELRRRHPAVDPGARRGVEHVRPRRAVRRRRRRAPTRRHHERHRGPRRDARRTRPASRGAEIAQREPARARAEREIDTWRRLVADPLDDLAGPVRPGVAAEHEHRARQVPRDALHRREAVAVRRPGERVRDAQRAVRHVVRRQRAAVGPPRVAAEMKRERAQVAVDLPARGEARHGVTVRAVRREPGEQRVDQRHRRRARRARRIEVVRLALVAPADVRRIDPPVEPAEIIPLGEPACGSRGRRARSAPAPRVPEAAGTAGKSSVSRACRRRASRPADPETALRGRDLVPSMPRPLLGSPSMSGKHRSKHMKLTSHFGAGGTRSIPIG